MRFFVVFSPWGEALAGRCGRSAPRWLEAVRLALNIRAENKEGGEMEFEADFNSVDFLREKDLSKGVGAELGWAARCAIGSLLSDGMFRKILKKVNKQAVAAMKTAEGPVWDLCKSATEFDCQYFRLNADVMEFRRQFKDDEIAKRLAFVDKFKISEEEMAAEKEDGIEQSWRELKKELSEVRCKSSKRRSVRRTRTSSSPFIDSVLSDISLKKLLDLVYHRQFTSWLHSQYEEKTPALPDSRLPIEDSTALKLNVLAYFAAALAKFTKVAKTDLILPALTAYILQMHINVQGPGAYLQLLTKCATDLKEKKTLQANIANLQDFSLYEELEKSAAELGLKLSLTTVQEAACKAAGLSDKPFTRKTPTSTSQAQDVPAPTQAQDVTAPTQTQDVTAPTSQAQDVTAPTSQAQDFTSPSLATSIRDLPAFRNLIKYFECAGKACIIETVRLQLFVRKWRRIFEKVGISLEEVGEVEDLSFYKSLSKVVYCSPPDVTIEVSVTKSPLAK